MIAQSDILTDVYDALGEVQGNSSWTDADIVREVNRAARRLATSGLYRVARFVVTGDGVSTSHTLPEPVRRIALVVENNAVTPQIAYADAVAAVFGRTLLAPDLYLSYGWAFEPPDRVRFQPVLANGNERTVYAVAGIGKIKETPYTTGTVSATNDSAVVTGSGTTWATNAATGETIAIAGDGYVIASVDSDTQITLTERYRGATASGLSYSIGGHLIAPGSASDLIAYTVAGNLAANFGDDETAGRNIARARRELRRHRGRMETLTTSGIRA